MTLEERRRICEQKEKMMANLQGTLDILRSKSHKLNWDAELRKLESDQAGKP